MKKDSIWLAFLPGFLVTIILAWVAKGVSAYQPMLDTLFVAFLGGIIISNILRNQEIIWTRAALCRDILIPIGLFLYGTQIQMKEWAAIKPYTFIISLVNILLYFSVAFFCNKYLFKITNNKISYMNGGANSICGVSATAVFIPFVKANEEEVASTLVAVVITGMVSVFSTYYLVQHLFALPLDKYATLCGLTLNQTGAVKTAAGFMGAEAEKIALAIKSFRTSLILPVAILMMLFNRAYPGQKQGGEKNDALKEAIGYGILVGLVFFSGSLLSSFTPLGSQAKAIKPWFVFIFSMTLASVGLLCDLRKISKRLVVLNTISCIIAWAVVVLATLWLINILL